MTTDPTAPAPDDLVTPPDDPDAARAFVADIVRDALDGTTGVLLDDVVGTSPLEYVKRAARRAVEDEHGEFSERRLAEIAERLGIGAPVAAKLEQTARDLATLTSAPPDTILEAFGKALAPEPAVAFRLRIRGAPYLAEAPIAGSPPGYRLHPDRRQRHQDRHTGGPRPTPRPERFLTRTRLAPGCHPRFMVWCITAAGDLR